MFQVFIVNYFRLWASFPSQENIWDHSQRNVMKILTRGLNSSSDDIKYGPTNTRSIKVTGWNFVPKKSPAFCSVHTVLSPQSCWSTEIALSLTWHSSVYLTAHSRYQYTAQTCSNTGEQWGGIKHKICGPIQKERLALHKHWSSSIYTRMHALQNQPLKIYLQKYRLTKTWFYYWCLRDGLG